ncbi:MAG: transcription termination/antitermination protein NusA [Candidatus Omnitrophica bacterium]|nr:transcription termination/antitermination protein NusA [Candidatus Omnitrophota bacterium]
MNGELLTILENIEKEKGIKKEILIEAVESAIASAARKNLGKKFEGEVAARLDIETGAIKILVNNEEIESMEMGRIAAQTAKQVIMQKIREAERDVIYEDFNTRIGQITNGTVHRFERGGLIIDLGRTEALLPLKEQSPKEKYRQGDRVRVYILEARRASKGPQVILSRSHAGLVQRLFELEVPEIYEGIVEIKEVAREAGERAKIAVWSKDEKVDPVGACVGMRGQRVKNVVRELQGERIDIIRWSEDTQQLITEALAPAQVQQIQLDTKIKKALVLVEDDQLSLAIGKRGQNVRLACKLTGWDIDIRSQSEMQQQEKAKEIADQIGIAELAGVGPKTKANLEAAGYLKVGQIAEATVDQLTKVKGVGQKSAEKLIQSAQAVLKEVSSPRKQAERMLDMLQGKDQKTNE